MAQRSNRTSWRNETGLALPAVLFVMALIGVLAATSLTTAGNERRAAHNMREATRALYAAEAGASTVIANWATAQYDTLLSAPGDSVALSTQTLPNGATYQPVLYRVDGGAGARLYSLSVQAATYSGAATAVSVLLSAQPGMVNTPAAITTGIGLRKNTAQGMNTGVDACGGPSITGLQTPYLQFTGDPTLVFDGTPPVDTVPDGLAALQALGIDWPGILGSTFNYFVDQNPPLGQWPDFASLPPDAYPTIVVTGSRIDLDAAHNGRGLLVVTEELRINNDWEWDGLILVGNFFQSNGQMTITGSMVSGLDLLLGRDPATMQISAIGPGTAQVTYDSCVLNSVAQAASWGNPVPDPVPGSWVGGG